MRPPTSEEGIPYLSEIFTDIICGRSKVVAERTRLSSLACALPKELARHMARVCILVSPVLYIRNL
jgi:hypothetical protein